VLESGRVGNSAYRVSGQRGLFFLKLTPMGFGDPSRVI
jgi:hypothetical protein